MIKEVCRENRRKFIIAGELMLATIIIVLASNLCSKYLTRMYDARVKGVLNNITYTEDSAYTEQKLLEKQLQYRLSNDVKGEVYQALASLSYMTGDDEEYNDNVSRAYFYLKQGHKVQEIARLYIKYIGRLYSNGCYYAAEQVLDTIRDNKYIDKCDADTTIEYYLSYVDVYEMESYYDKAEQYINKSRKAIADTEDSSDKQMNLAKCDLLTTRLYIYKGEYSKAKKLLNEYSESDSFGLEADNLYVICDFKIPFLELNAKIALYDKEYDEAYNYADQYINYCDEYNFRIMKLNMLKYIVSDVNKDNEKNISKYKDMELYVSEIILNDLTNQYGNYLISDIDGQVERQEKKKDVYESLKNNIIEIIILVYCLIIFVCIISIMISYLNKDGLTRLNNRKIYEHDRERMERKKKTYHLLMIDIDNFKNINDTYGHQTGDIVLKQIADILKQICAGKEKIKAYRYGGEEMCLIFYNCSDDQVCEKSERIRTLIRREVSKDEMLVTVSGGAAVSHNGENVFQEADKCLYYSKGHGKNMIKYNFK